MCLMYARSSPYAGARTESIWLERMHKKGAGENKLMFVAFVY